MKASKERFVIGSRFIASIYDIRFSNTPLDKKKFRDIFRASNLIDSYYQLSSNEDMAAKVNLKKITEHIQVKSDFFTAIESEVNDFFAEAQNELPLLPTKDNIFIPYQWDNEIYQALVKLLIETDKLSYRLQILHINNAIDKGVYFKSLKKAANPIRSILDVILKR